MAVVHFDVPADAADGFVARSATALSALAACEGYLWGGVGPATDDPGVWVMVTRWQSVGRYRRALSSYDVKLRAHPLLYEARDVPSAFEEVLAAAPGGPVDHTASDRAADAAVTGPGGIGT